jgi:hypothetical protein
MAPDAGCLESNGERADRAQRGTHSKVVVARSAAGQSLVMDESYGAAKEKQA